VGREDLLLRQRRQPHRRAHHAAGRRADRRRLRLRRDQQSPRSDHARRHDSAFARLRRQRQPDQRQRSRRLARVCLQQPQPALDRHRRRDRVELHLQRPRTADRAPARHQHGGGPTEYIYLPEAEIAPTILTRSEVDRPIAVVEGVNTASPALWFVHVDHLSRPVLMTNTSKAVVWDAVFLPWGGVHSISGSATLDARFPGQWFQLESGLHYNWHRQYDPTIGRYIQSDPLGFVDGPSGFGYAGGSPIAAIDPDGQNMLKLALELCKRNPKCGEALVATLAAAAAAAKKCKCKVEKHGPDHRFRDARGKDMGFCDHYQVTCWIEGVSGSNITYRWPLSGRCTRMRTNEPGLPMPKTEGSP
jgi:RHS repeat-associated protein